MEVLQSRRVRWASMIMAIFVVSVMLLAQFPLAGTRPEVMLLVAACAGMVGGPGRGAWVGFVSGFLVDLTLYGTLGVAALCFTVVGFFVGTVADVLPNQSRVFSLLIAAVASISGVALYAVVAQFLGGHTLTDPGFGFVVAIVAVWNAVLCMPVLALARWAEGARVALR